MLNRSTSGTRSPAAKDKAALISGKVRNKDVIKKANKFINDEGEADRLHRHPWVR